MALGWAEFEANSTEYCDVMKMFAPEMVPIISTLAQEFSLFDNFFASHPGPTWPNRLFCLTGTSAGCTETGTYYLNQDLRPYPQRTIFDSFADAGYTWRNYYNDTPWSVPIANGM
jgi:phospholipase C